MLQTIKNIILGKSQKKVEPKVEVEKGVSYLDFMNAIGKKFKVSTNKDELYKTIMPRTINDIVPINAKTGKKVAMDSCFRKESRFEGDIPDEIMRLYSSTFIGWQACAILKQNSFIDKACQIPCKDAIAPDYKLSFEDNDDIDNDGKKDKLSKEDKEKLLAEIKRKSKKVYDINNVCMRMSINKKVFGYGLVVPDIEDADYENPFNIDGIKKGSYKGMTVLDPYWISPELDAESTSNPASKHFYDPTWYKVAGGKRIHRSWVIKVINSEVSDILKPTYYFGGIPLTQQIYERVYAAEKVANEAPLLAMTKRLLVADANIQNMVANPEEAAKIMENVKWFRDNFAVWFKNPGDTITQIDTALTDFDAMVMTQYQLVASIAEMPATKLLKTTPKGFNSTGDYEQDDYNQSLIDIQENDYVPLIDFHNQLMTKSEYDKEIKLKVTFNPIDTPTEKEVAEVEEIKSRTAGNYINAGVISPEEERGILRTDTDGRYTSLDEDMEESDQIDMTFEDVA